MLGSCHCVCDPPTMPQGCAVRARGIGPPAAAGGSLCDASAGCAATDTAHGCPVGTAYGGAVPPREPPVAPRALVRSACAPQRASGARSGRLEPVSGDVARMSGPPLCGWPGERCVPSLDSHSVDVVDACS